MNVLFVSYFYPPDKAVGGIRPSSFCNYLAENDVKVFLLTSNRNVCVNNKGTSSKTSITPICSKRPKLREIGYKTKILVFLELFKLDQLFFFPDIYFQWIKPALREAQEKLSDIKLDAIIATAPPYSSIIIGYELSKKFNVPLVLDYRDPWSGNPFIKFPFSLGKRRVKKVEKKIAESADLIVTVGEDCAKLISESIDIPIDSIKIVYNGFSLDTIPTSFSKKGENKFVISYFGNFYLLQKKTMQHFFFGLGKFIKENRINSDELVFQYAGNTSRKVLKRMLKRANVSLDYFSDLGYLSKEELFNAIDRSHLVIDIVPRKTEYMLHTKVYDYASANSHILLVGEEGELDKLCFKIEQKFSRVTEKVEEISIKLENLWDLWKVGKLEYGCNREKLSFFSRKNQSRIFIELLFERFRK
ncbi:MAG: glycosyltransferase [Candidatus Heimdallarchaeaceae archaeon]